MGLLLLHHHVSLAPEGRDTGQRAHHLLILHVVAGISRPTLVVVVVVPLILVVGVLGFLVLVVGVSGLLVLVIGLLLLILVLLSTSALSSASPGLLLLLLCSLFLP